MMSEMDAAIFVMAYILTFVLLAVGFLKEGDR